MIHESSRRALGFVERNGKVVGHCVLISPTLAVTCAHVICEKVKPPNSLIQLRFPLLDFCPIAKICAWRHFDRNLSRGSDIAVLSFVDNAEAPSGAAVSQDGERPPGKTAVFALEFLTARSDGDLREGSIFDSVGSMISLKGDRFLEPCMSGAGIFYSKPGERLLGLISGRPKKKGTQTDGYAIPSDEILKVVAEIEQTAEGSGLSVSYLQTLFFCAGNAVGDNFRAFVEDYVTSAMASLKRPKEEWREEDIAALRDLQLELEDAFKSDIDGKSNGLPIGLAAVLARIFDLCSELDPLFSRLDTRLDLTDQMRTLLGEASAACCDVLDGDRCPKDARESMQQLRLILRSSLDRGYTRPRQLSERADLASRRMRGAFSLGLRLVLTALGQRPDLLPAGTFFRDSAELWAPEMVVIPVPETGSFMMGSHERDPHRGDDETLLEVSISKKFALGRYAISFEVFDAYCNEAGKDELTKSDWGRGFQPATYLSWFEATDFCRWLSAQTGAVYRLPTEAEWEYSCRADKTGKSETLFCPSVALEGKGNFLTPQEANFNGSESFNDSLKGENREQTVPVNFADFAQNAFGLFQMHGNTDEWCLDIYERDYSTVIAEHGSQAGVPPQSDGARSVRGGNWYNNPKSLRSAFRCKDAPDDRSNSVSFRPLREL